MVKITSLKTSAGTRFGFIFGEYKVFLSKHTYVRAEERLSELGICLVNTEQYAQLCADFLNNMISDSLVSKYINNFRYKTEVLFKDTRTKMNFVLLINPFEKEVECITFGTDHNSKWTSKLDTDKVAWLYQDIFVFTGYNGNIVWTR